MVTTNENFEDDNSSSSASIDGGASSALRSQLDETLVHCFNVAHGSAAQRVQTGLLQQVRAGTLNASDLCIRINGADLAVAQQQFAEAESKKSCENHLFLITLSNLDAQIAALDAIADRMEDDFEDKYGDSWREDLALTILGEDEIPQRQDGESLADYRDRVEQALIDEMIDDDGNIKPQYRDHPEYGDRARWAQTRWKQQNKTQLRNDAVAVLEDETLSQDERIEMLERVHQDTLSDAKVGLSEEDAALVDAVMDARRETDCQEAGVATDQFSAMMGLDG